MSVRLDVIFDMLCVCIYRRIKGGWTNKSICSRSRSWRRFWRKSPTTCGTIITIVYLKQRTRTPSGVCWRRRGLLVTVMRWTPVRTASRWRRPTQMLRHRRRGHAATVSCARARRASARGRSTPTDQCFATVCGRRRPACCHRRRWSPARLQTTRQIRIRSLTVYRVVLPSPPSVQITRTDASIRRTYFLATTYWRSHLAFRRRLCYRISSLQITA